METKKGKICPEAIVGALVMNDEGEMLLGKSKKWKDKYTIVGGHVEIGETMEEAVKREVKEETGIDVEVVDKLGFLESIFDKDFNDQKHFIFLDFLCRFSGDKNSVKLNGEFEDEYLWVSPEKGLTMNIPLGTRRIIEEYLEYKKQHGYLAGWKRCQADFENYKKRQTEKQKEWLEFGNMKIISEILPVLDNFHASTDHVPEAQKNSAWVKGIMHIQSQLEKVLTDNGIEEIKTKAGDKFKPEIMEAIENKEVKPEDCKNIVKQVVTRGYKMGDRVMRAVRVIVE